MGKATSFREARLGSGLTKSWSLISVDPAWQYFEAETNLANAADDYAAARCCLLNQLTSGGQLAAQAIEKTMKGLYVICGGTPRKRKHDWIALHDDLISVRPNAAEIPKGSLEILFQQYEHRYPPSDPKKDLGKVSWTPWNDLVLLDQIMWILIDIQPRPERFLTTGVPYVLRRIAANSIGAEQAGWLTIHNQAMAPHLPALLVELEADLSPSERAIALRWSSMLPVM